MRHLSACVLTATILASTAPGMASAGQNAIATDINLVTALDLSDSIMRHEEWLEFDGLAKAVESELFLEALSSGYHGRIGFAVFLWSSERPDLIVPWTLIGSKQDAHRVAQALRAAQVAHDFGRRMKSAGASASGHTDISTAIESAAMLLQDAPYEARRAVANICGNGRDNVGAHPDDARDRALAAGIVINGLVIGDRQGVAAYYRARVQGGGGSFVLKVREPEAIANAMPDVAA